MRPAYSSAVSSVCHQYPIAKLKPAERRSARTDRLKQNCNATLMITCRAHEAAPTIATQRARRRTRAPTAYTAGRSASSSHAQTLRARSSPSHPGKACTLYRTVLYQRAQQPIGPRRSQTLCDHARYCFALSTICEHIRLTNTDRRRPAHACIRAVALSSSVPVTVDCEYSRQPRLAKATSAVGRYRRGPCTGATLNPLRYESLHARDSINSALSTGL